MSKVKERNARIINQRMSGLATSLACLFKVIKLSDNEEKNQQKVSIMHSKLQIAVTICAMMLVPASVGSAQSYQLGTISMIRTGWSADSFAVLMATATPNPAGCAKVDGAISDKSLPGYSTLYAAALTAYVARRPVQVIVHPSECYGDWPKLIGINLSGD